MHIGQSSVGWGGDGGGGAVDELRAVCGPAHYAAPTMLRSCRVRLRVISAGAARCMYCIRVVCLDGRDVARRAAADRGCELLIAIVWSGVIGGDGRCASGLGVGWICLAVRYLRCLRYCVRSSEWDWECVRAQRGVLARPVHRSGALHSFPRGAQNPNLYSKNRIPGIGGPRAAPSADRRRPFLVTTIRRVAHLVCRTFVTF